MEPTKKEPDSRTNTIYLKDYTPPHFKITETRLDFYLDPEKTIVKSDIDFVPIEHKDLVLDGVGLRLISISINNEELAFGDISIEDGNLTIEKSAIPKTPFTLSTEVEINPSTNTSLDGLYLSNGMYCTQCEAQGFRKITYYPDRPDVMTTFRVNVHSDLPVKLSNGNLISSKDGVSSWHDPWPKPCYLFALVAGDLQHISDQYTTMEGRKVDLQIYVRKGDETRCDYAMDALKRSMKWDEETYGLSYDLDLFMIVAVDDFNMGAMENKGLNIFNSRLVLASPETATDADYAAIESVIAHEYFHNWTGNRITCRDWFQLSLKEGLTVFRDQQFSAHERSSSVQRIEDVKSLRARQFPEDAGPLAHPVRPESYVEINNFYTATIYEKGAELIGMMRGLVGAENYRKALDLYFDRHDGQACTIEDWLAVFTDITGRDFEQFKLWYKQSGTPIVHINTKHDGERFVLELRQELQQTPNQNRKKPMLIPLAYALYKADGEEIQQGVLELDDLEETLYFDVPEGTQLSINQGFSAPIILKQNPFDASFFARFDIDPYNRFEALRQMKLNVLALNHDPKLLIDIMGEIAVNSKLDPDFRALMLGLPSFGEVVTALKSNGKTPDPTQIANKISELKSDIGEMQNAVFLSLYNEMCDFKTTDLSAVSAGKRSLSLCALSYLSSADHACKDAKNHYNNAMLMTDKIGALAILVQHENGKTESTNFFETYQNERLIVDKYLSVLASCTPHEKALETVKLLEAHPCFENANPNRFRSLYGGFASGNPAAFHTSDGSGYKFLADVLIEFDQKNPQTAARLSTCFQSWRDFDEGRQDHAKHTLKHILNAPNLSENLREMVSRTIDT